MINLRASMCIYITGKTKNKKNPTENSSQSSKNQNWTARTLIYLNVCFFGHYSNALNKGLKLFNHFQILTPQCIQISAKTVKIKAKSVE